MTYRQILWSISVFLCLGVCASAQPPLTIKAVQFGFPSTKSSRQVRVGAWNPISVTLKAGKNPVDQRSYKMMLQTTDAHGAANFYVSDIPSIGAGQERVALSYIKIDNETANLDVAIRQTDEQGKPGSTVTTARGRHPTPQSMVQPQHTLYLTLGAPLPRLEKALIDAEERTAEAQERQPEVLRFAHVGNLESLPDKWFGYDGVDIVVLPTNNPMVTRWLDRQSQGGNLQRAQFNALVEWVRRGGKLMLSVAKNYDRLNNAPGYRKLIRAPLRGTFDDLTITQLSDWAQFGQQEITGVQLAEVDPGDGVAVLATESFPDSFRQTLGALGGGVARANVPTPGPLLLDAPCGRGRVLLLAIDIESRAFTEWGGQDAFWVRVHKELRPRQVILKKNDSAGIEAQELAHELQRSMETFQGVPVISFGWIVLLILGYIIIIGPVEYLFLKRVLKKVELTWITFPTLVVLISLTAYFAAYSIKGKDLRIKKVDVVDIDLHQNLVNTTTWVSVFSPRLQNYTIGVEPVWGSSKSDRTSTVLLSAMSSPDASIGGSNRPAGPSLFRRPYEYANQGQGLQDVPISVWSARSFVANWRGNGADQLFGTEDLTRDTNNPDRILGTLVSKLPVTLEEVSLHHKGAWFTKESPLSPGQPWRLVGKLGNLGLKGENDSTRWLGESFGGGSPTLPTASGKYGYEEERAVAPVPALMKSILFHTHVGDPRKKWRNSRLRDLDQGWRLQSLSSGRDQYSEELTIVGRVVRDSTTSEQANNANTMPTRLWLGQLPGGNEPRPELSGYLTQETYVRIFIPVPRRPNNK